MGGMRLVRQARETEGDGVSRQHVDRHQGLALREVRIGDFAVGRANPARGANPRAHEPAGGRAHLSDGSYVYNPSPDQALAAGTRLIVMGESRSVEKLRKLIHRPLWPERQGRSERASA
jgi:hypothetical protein